MALWWLSLNILTLIMLAFYSMLEMACVSFNKVRLQYYVSKGIKRAEWLNYLLHHPSRLFGTTLIGVNLAMFIGSECSREFYKAIGFDPNYAPLSQVLIVIIFGELAPMFAARHYPEHVAMMGAPIVYASSKIMAPFIWILGKISTLSLWLIGNKHTDPNLFLSQEELIKILEEQDEEMPQEGGDSEDLNIIATNIFALRNKNVGHIMFPLASTPIIPSHATVLQMKNMLKRTFVDFLPIYHRHPQNIISIVRPRDVLRASDSKRVQDFARAPWFITQTSALIDILKQFRQNKENIAIVLNQQGNAVGIVTLDAVLEEIFGKGGPTESQPDDVARPTVILIDRTFPGDFTVGEFNQQFQAGLPFDESITLRELVVEVLGHPPEAGDSITISNFEITVKESSLLGAKSLVINTIIR